MQITYLVAGTPGKGNDAQFVLTGHLSDRQEALRIAKTPSDGPFGATWQKIELLTCYDGVLSETEVVYDCGHTRER
jgi:hypothetical protein